MMQDPSAEVPGEAKASFKHAKTVSLLALRFIGAGRGRRDNN